jgi:hypothetical protein
MTEHPFGQPVGIGRLALSARREEAVRANMKEAGYGEL